MPNRWHPRKHAQLARKIIARDGDFCVLCVLDGRSVGDPIVDATIDHLNNNKRDDRLDNLIRLCRSCNSSEENRRRAGARLLTPENFHEKAAEAYRFIMSVRGKRHVAAANSPSGGLQGLPVANPQGGAPIYNGRAPSSASPGALVSPRCVSESESDRGSLGESPETRVSEGVGPPRGRIAHAALDRPELDTEAEDAAILGKMMNPLYRLWLYDHVLRHGFITKGGALDAGGEFLIQTLGCGNQITVGRYFRNVTNPINGWLEETRDARGKATFAFRPGVNLAELRVLLRGRVDALNTLLTGRPVDLSAFDNIVGDRAP